MGRPALGNGLCPANLVVPSSMGPLSGAIAEFDAQRTNYQLSLPILYFGNCTGSLPALLRTCRDTNATLLEFPDSKMVSRVIMRI
jgi:hypothetical protein